MSTFFISDLHLQPAQPQLLAGCLQFLRTTAKDAEALYILGDLFEVWVGDDDDAPWLPELRDALKILHDRGTRLYFLHGNRDFLLGEQFAERCGMTLLPEAVVIDLYGRKALLLHGDTLCTGDREYLAMRGQLHNPQWQQAVLARSLAERRQLATSLRMESKAAGALKNADIMDVTPSEVENVMAAQGVDLLIHGHTHRPARHNLTVSGKAAERIVLGDWGPSLWYLRADADGALQLVEQPLAI
ncbi:MAG: UDP-2,3-diacylglucosamine diphosphatase [Spongiibacteraceae bacterium]